MRSGEKVRVVREHRGAKQYQLAQALGISQSAYSRLERGRREIKLEYLRILARELRWPLGDLVDPNPPRGLQPYLSEP
ncbi:MAG TPA: helix-turn-helix transcriptional regulator [Flavobacteriales bacterium]|jgi:transcriptional regulator with XRE-family HTH domain|nr:helix-turn-helix transcriptional regulator [Flavobacteriales bacterium]